MPLAGLTALGAVVFLAGLGGLPQRPYEAAAVDGASTWQIFRHLTLPMLSPFILVMLLIRLIDAFKIFEACETTIDF